MSVPVLVIDSTYVDPAASSWIFFGFFVLEICHFVLEIPWIFFAKSAWTPCFGARNPYRIVHDRANFFGKTFVPKIGEMGQKQAKTIF